MHFLSEDIFSQISIPEQGVLSRTIHNDDAVKIIVFGFSQGHELSAHMAPMAATLQILRGKATVQLGDEVHNLSAGALVHMPPNLKHGIIAQSPMILLLQLFKGSK